MIVTLSVKNNNVIKDSNDIHDGDDNKWVGSNCKLQLERAMSSVSHLLMGRV